MKLHGQAGSTELFELFQLLANSQKTGVLLVKHKEEVRKVQFTPQGVTLLFETETETRLLGSILVHRGRINRTQLDKTLELQKTTHKKLGELLVQTGIAKAEDVNEALAYQLGEELFDLLRWEGASFDFKEGVVELEGDAAAGRMPMRKYQATPLFNVGSILMEAARRADEWKRIHGVLTSSKTILIRRTQEWSDHGEFGDVETARKIWDLLDGTQNLEDLMQRTSFSRFQVFESAYELHRAGLVKLISPEELLTQAEETLVAGKTEYGLGLLAKACEGLKHRPELQAQAGQLYFWAKRDDEARETLDEALAELMKRGQLEVALKFLESLHRQYPDRAYPLERLIRLHREVPDFESAKQAAIELLGQYQAKHEQDKIQRLLKFLSEFPIKNEPSRLSLGKLLVSFGASQLAAEQYELLGRTAQKSGNRTDAISHYRQAVHLDPTRTEAQRRLARLTAAPRMKTRKWLKRLAAAAVLLCMAGGIAAEIRNELRSREDWMLMRQDVRELVVKRDFQEARRLCNDFIDKAILTTTTEAARKELGAIDSAEIAYLTQCKQKDQVLWDAAARAENDKDYAATVEAYARVAKEAGSSAMAAKARARVEELRGERDQFEKLLSDASKAESERDYAGAVKKYLEAATREPGEWSRRGLTLPVEVRSTPAKAEVWKDGKLLGQTPLTIRRGLSEAPTLTVKANGYLPGRLRISTEGQPASASIELIETRVARWTYRSEGAVDVPVSVEGGGLFVSSRAGQVTALETETGRVLWTKKMGGLRGSYLSQGVRQDQAIYVLQGAGRVTRLSADDGKESWSKDMNTLLTGSPVLSRAGEMVVAAANGKVYGLNTSSGEMRWVVVTGEQTRWVIGSGEGCVCVGAESVRYVPAAQSQGSREWKRSLELTVSAMPVISNGRIYVPGSTGVLTVLDERTGETLSRHTLGDCALGSPTLSDGTIIAPDANGTVRAIDKETGKKLWENSLGEPTSAGGSCYKGTFYIGTDRGSLMALDAGTGKVKWQATLEGAVQSPPVEVGGLCVTTTRTGMIYAMPLK